MNWSVLVEIDVALEVVLPEIGDLIVTTIYPADKFLIHQLRESATDLLPGFVDVYRNYRWAENQFRLTESFENPIVNRQLHPPRGFPGSHFDFYPFAGYLSYFNHSIVICISLNREKFYGLGSRYREVQTDATLLGKHYWRKTVCDPASKARSRVGSTDMKSNESEGLNGSSRPNASLANRREQLRTCIDELPETKVRAGHALIDLKQLHLSEYDQ